MNKEAVRTMIMMLLCAVGGVLIGLNATRLSNGLGAALFELGIVFVSMSVTVESLFQTVWKKRK